RPRPLVVLAPQLAPPQPSREQRPPRLQPSGLHLEVAAEGGDGLGPLVQSGPGGALRRYALRPGPLLCFQSGEGCFQLRDPTLLAAETLLQLGEVGPEALVLAPHVAPLRFDTRQRVGHSREP